MSVPILNESQALAVYDAMMALNNVNGRVDITLPCGGGTAVRVRETWTGSVQIEGEFRGIMTDKPWLEKYPDQDAFAKAYGIKS